MLLNNDTVVDSEFLTEMVKVGERDANIGIVGPKVYYYSEPNRINFAGGRVNLWKGRSYHIGCREI
ncbi:rhamnosyltransferase, partial [Candidatus Hakubella thermalkaliphila]